MEEPPKKKAKSEKKVQVSWEKPRNKTPEKPTTITFSKDIDPEWTFLLNEEIVSSREFESMGVSSLHIPLSKFLRDHKGLKGTKVACGEGVCGACTVLLQVKGEKEVQPVSSCLLPLGSVLSPPGKEPGVSITTIDIAQSTQEGKQLKKLARDFANDNALQCGFCSPGMVMKLYSLLQKGGKLSETEAEDALNGNICRCTGYRPILLSFKKALDQKGILEAKGMLPEEIKQTPECIPPNRKEQELQLYGHNKAHPNVKIVPAKVKEPLISLPMREEGTLSDASLPEAFARVALLASNRADSVSGMVPSDLVKMDKAVPATPEVGPIRGTFITNMLPVLVDTGTENIQANIGAKEEEGSHEGTADKGSVIIDDVPHLTIGNSVWYYPKDEGGLVQLVTHSTASQQMLPPADKEQYRVVAGNAASAYETINNNPCVVSLAHVSEFASISHTGEELTIGSGVTIGRLQKYAKETLPERLAALSQWLLRVANMQVRNLGTVGGNLMASLFSNRRSDLVLAFLPMNARLSLLVTRSTPEDPKHQKVTKEEEILLSEWHTTYSKEISTETIKGMILRHISVTLPPETTTFAMDRIADRLENMPSLHSIALRCDSQESDLNECCITAWVSCDIPLKKEDATATRGLHEVQVSSQKVSIHQKSPKEDKKALIEYLKALWTDTRSTYADTLEQMHQQRLPMIYTLLVRNLPMCDPALGSSAGFPDTSLLNERRKDRCMGSQTFQVATIEDKVSEFGQPVIRPSAHDLAMGRGVYTQDVPVPHGTWHAFYVLARHALVQFDCKKLWYKMRARAMKKVHPSPQLLTYLDVEKMAESTEMKDFNVVFPPYETILAPGKTFFSGQPIAMVLHPDAHTAMILAQQIQDDIDKEQVGHPDDCTLFTPLDPDDKDRIALDPTSKEKKVVKHVTSRGSPPSKDEWEQWKKDENILVIEKKGLHAPSQVHLYMETQGAMVYQTAPDQYIVYCSTQSTSLVQSKVQRVLDVPVSNIAVHSSRLGGGFGGKEPQSVPTAVGAAFAARLLDKPVRLVLERPTDMRMIGKRHEMTGSFKLAYNLTEERIIAADIVLEVNAGCSWSCSKSVQELAVLMAENCYYIERFRCAGEATLSPVQTRTAMRSFGVVQSTYISESIFEELSDTLQHIQDDAFKGKDALRRRHFTQQYEGDLPHDMNDLEDKYKTSYGQYVREAHLMPHIFDQLRDTAQVNERRKAIAQFNRENKWRKRALSVIPIRYGISFTYIPMNQGGALVSVYKGDGSVTIHQGGVEMGQGLYAKLKQLACVALDLPLEKILIKPHRTDVLPNAIDSGASTGLDINGPAVTKACLQLANRLKNRIHEEFNGKEGELKDDDRWYLDYLKDGNSWRTDTVWKGVVNWAYKTRIQLFEVASHQSLADSDVPLSKTDIFYFFNYAAAATEVEVDMLSGEVDVRQADILYDSGPSANPAIDLGQVEGAFVQGLGNMLSEQMRYEPWPHKAFITDRLRKYGVPSHRRMPRIFNVSLYAEPKAVPTTETSPVERMERPVDVSQYKRSKTAGEPPLVLSVSAFFALREALKYARKQVQAEKNLQHDSLDYLCPPAIPPKVFSSIWNLANEDVKEWLENFIKQF